MKTAVLVSESVSYSRTSHVLWVSCFFFWQHMFRSYESPGQNACTDLSPDDCCNVCMTGSLICTTVLFRWCIESLYLILISFICCKFVPHSLVHPLKRQHAWLCVEQSEGWTGYNCNSHSHMSEVQVCIGVSNSWYNYYYPSELCIYM